jgi:hypothetical protein
MLTSEPGRSGCIPPVTTEDLNLKNKYDDESLGAAVEDAAPPTKKRRVLGDGSSSGDDSYSPSSQEDTSTGTCLPSRSHLSRRRPPLAMTT